MNTHRYIARIILEAETPLFVGSGEASLLKDALVQKDFNGLPMIPGTSLTGVLRHSIENVLEMASNEKSIWNSIFGFQEGDKGSGSRLRLSSAYIMINEKEVAEGLNITIDDTIKAKFDNLPTRQHVRIDHKGVAIGGGLFDNEVVYKGTRFKFEIELIGNESDRDTWDNILNKIQSPLFRMGQGTRNGYGNLKVYQIKSRIFDLKTEKDFNDYSAFDVSLNVDDYLNETTISEETIEKELIKYSLQLHPDSDFFIFSEGFGDEDVDNKPLEEEIVVYENGTLTFKDKQTVIPASSIKGALAHRTAFHYNKLKERFADQLFPTLGKEIAVELYTGSGNKAVNELFGLGSGFEWKEAKEKVKNMPPPEYDEYGSSSRGKVIINDLYFSESEVKNDKIFNHVAIDRFTGGAMEGALFSEKVSSLNGTIELNIFVEKVNYDDDVRNAFENALLDITKGLLPLGGMTTKGYGMFTGSVTRDSEPILNYHQKEKKNDNN
jgi:CRISPR/Cas system CSM-associated protein Csm3 (group 7 of RAMP superfamily)